MLNFIFLYYGFLAILAQLVIFRELAVLFCGNELFLGTFLSSWLFWVGLGSAFTRRLLKKESPQAVYFSCGFLAIALLFPSLILLIRASKGFFAFGEFIGPLPTILYTFSAMSVLCFVLGSQFSLACSVAPDKRGAALGRVYLYEAQGAVIAGAAFTYLFAGKVPAFIIALALSFGCVTASLGLLIKKISLKGVMPIVAALLILFVDFKAEPAINRFEWNKYQFIRQKEARNFTLSLVNMGSIQNVFVDGMLAASFPAPESYEPQAHWPLLASAKPQQILILGDASLGALKEVFKHNPGRVDYVAIDNSFLDLVGPYLKKDDIDALRNPALQIYYADARVFVGSHQDKYDAVIMNIPEAPNLKTNRFYTEEFYSRIMRILKPDGILGLSVVSSENYLSGQTRVFNASVYATLKAVFKAVEIIPGDSLTFLASPSQIDTQKETILGRFNSRAISNQYLIPSYIEYKLETGRRAELKKMLEDTPGVAVNRDFFPSTCYYLANLWMNKFASPSGYLALVILFIIAVGVYKKRSSLFPSGLKKESLLVFFIGFIGMLLELVLLLGYQIISGDIYWQLGILFAAFMSGLCLGALLGNWSKDNSRRIHFAILVVLTLVIITLSACAAHLLPRLFGLSTLQNMGVFILFLFFIGLVVGAAFVIAGFLMREDNIMKKAGSLYAADLWGAALGAIISTNLIAPVFGILRALNLAALIGAAGLTIFLILSRKTELC